MIMSFGADAILSTVFFHILIGITLEYEVPEVQFEAYSPKGLSVSIPHEEGISLFAFHGKINEEMNGREAGKYSVDILKAQNGRWTYRNRAVKLKPGDVINYWVNVDYDDGEGVRGYIKDDSFTVTELLNIEALGGGTTTVAPTTKRTSRTTKTPTKTPTCFKSPTTVNGLQRCAGDLIFEDTFDEFDRTKWQNEIKFAGDPDYEFVLYENNKANIYVQNKKLHIKPTLTDDKYGNGFVSSPTGLDLGENCTGIPGSQECRQKAIAFVVLPPVISAQITTKNQFYFTYGTIEVRARLPKGNWIYPELYLRSKNEPYGSGLDSGMMRIAFAPGNQNLNTRLHGGCLLGQSLNGRNFGIRSVRFDKDWSDAFHTYRIDWKPDGITLMVDDRVYGNIYPPDGGFASQREFLEVENGTAEKWKKGTPMAPFDKDMYLVVGVGVGGQVFPDSSDQMKPWRNDDPKAQKFFYRAQSTWSETWDSKSVLVVDYIKAWAL